MYAIIEKETGEVIFTTSDETRIEIFFAIEDSSTYEVVDIQDMGYDSFDEYKNVNSYTEPQKNNF